MKRLFLIGAICLAFGACSPPADAGHGCRIGHWRPLAKICHRIKMRRMHRWHHCKPMKHHKHHCPPCKPKPCKPCDVPDAPAAPA